MRCAHAAARAWRAKRYPRARRALPPPLPGDARTTSSLFDGTLEMLHALQGAQPLARRRHRQEPHGASTRRSAARRSAASSTPPAPPTRRAAKPDPLMLARARCASSALHAGAHADGRRHDARPAARRQRRLRPASRSASARTTTSEFDVPRAAARRALDGRACRAGWRVMPEAPMPLPWSPRRRCRRSACCVAARARRAAAAAIVFDVLHCRRAGARLRAALRRPASSAYLNRCAHVPTELDWQPGEFLDADQRVHPLLDPRRRRTQPLPIRFENP